MFLTPYHTASHTVSETRLQAENEARAFAFWQSLMTARDQFTGVYGDIRAKAQLVTEGGKPTALRLPDGREVAL